MTYRFANEHDAPLLAQLNLQLIQDEGHRNPMDVPELTDRMKKWLRSGYKAVIFEEDSVVAYALFRKVSHGIYLRQFFVPEPERRKGYGSEAMRLLVEEIWPKGIRVTLDVLAHNEGAHGFWKSVGFTDYSVRMKKLPKNGVSE